MPATQNCSTDGSDQRRIRVVVVDDSALMRQILTSVLNADPGIEVVGAAWDPLHARRLIKDLDPDVVTLDVDMPKMNGLSFLEKIMTLRPMPVIMVSNLTKRGAETTVRALACGALDFVAKPSGATQDGLSILAAALIAKVKAAASTRLAIDPEQALRISASAPACARRGADIIGIGASTGGVAAVQAILSALPPTTPGILIAQHMPPAFTRSFAARLHQHCALTVVEARDGEQVSPGHAYVAPGGRHLEIVRGQRGFTCRLHDGALVSGHRPSVDVLFRSIAREAGDQAMGVILTGMGRDGADGLLAMRRAGAVTLGQQEASCVVYGMPRVASEIGAVDAEISLADIARKISSARTVAKAALRAS